MTLDEAMAKARAALDQITATKLEELRIDLLDAGYSRWAVKRVCKQHRREMAKIADAQLAAIRRDLEDIDAKWEADYG
jgi:hypothetical protein